MRELPQVGSANKEKEESACLAFKVKPCVAFPLQVLSGKTLPSFLPGKQEETTKIYFKQFSGWAGALLSLILSFQPDNV